MDVRYVILIDYLAVIAIAIDAAYLAFIIVIAAITLISNAVVLTNAITHDVAWLSLA